MTVGQIPWTAVRMYADRYGLSLEEEEELLVYVRAIDAALITNDE